jgi:hypothetical protein
LSMLFRPLIGHFIDGSLEKIHLVSECRRQFRQEIPLYS